MQHTRHASRCASVSLRRRALASPSVFVLFCAVCWLADAAKTSASDPAGDAVFRAKIQPILAQHCYDCHGNGMSEAGVALDAAETDAAVRHDPQLWWRVIKQLRAGLMPPEGGEPLSAGERAQVEKWIKKSAFGYDHDRPDPGAVTLRRLNRIEYRNTIRDLLGVDFDAAGSFPPDDAGHGFDNIGDVLSVSPLLLEKYIEAAAEIIGQAVPMAPRIVAEQPIPGGRLRLDGQAAPPAGERGPLRMTFYKPGKASYTHRVDKPGDYQLVVDMSVNEVYVDGVFDYNKCRVTFSVDGQQRHTGTYSWQGEEGDYHFEWNETWSAGEHVIVMELEPLTPDEPQTRTLSVRLERVNVRGPLAEEHWVEPGNYAQYFPRPVPADEAGRRQYARELLGQFATRAFRRPVEADTLDRLVAMAEQASGAGGQPFEAGVAKSMVAVLASPRFLFRQEAVEQDETGAYPYVDQYALASRLSYFLWSTMPDEQLIRLAREGKLRDRLAAQVRRMLSDPRAESFTRNFVGQWLQARDIETVLINSFVVAARDNKPNPDFDRRRDRFRKLNRKSPEELTDAEREELQEARRAFREMFSKFRQFDLNDELRRAMRRETDMQFEYVVRENRPLTELLDCNYAFLNERLAQHYKIDGVKGAEMRRVELPPDSPRGGVLTQGTVLVVTSNPDRTSPVKRGLFVLENLLGTPPAPPPPNVPALEEEDPRKQAVTLTLRESLVKHRADPLCSSCHARMDPLGLALENFNALGIYRDSERGLAIDPTGELASGEKFSGVRDLKRILVEEHREEFYRILAEKMLTYALGRGLDYHDVGVVDEIVQGLERQGGRPSALILGIVRSAPFQKRRPVESTSGAELASQASYHPRPGVVDEP